MGGLRGRIPVAWVAILVGTLAIIGFPGLSGFFSKDAVIYGALEHGYPALYAIGVLTAGITAYYMFRMLFVAFTGAYRGEIPDAQLGIPERAQTESHHGPEAPRWVMELPVVILMVPSIFAGYVWLFGWPRFFAVDFAPSVAVPVAGAIPEWLSTMLVLAVVGFGFALAYYRYGTSAAKADAVARLRAESLAMPQILVHAFYFDDAIEVLFVRPARAIGAAFMRFVDPRLIDGDRARRRVACGLARPRCARDPDRARARVRARHRRRRGLRFSRTMRSPESRDDLGACDRSDRRRAAPLRAAAQRRCGREMARRRGCACGVRRDAARRGRAGRVAPLAAAPVYRELPPRARWPVIVDRSAAGARDGVRARGDANRAPRGTSSRRCSSCSAR